MLYCSLSSARPWERDRTWMTLRRCLVMWLLAVLSAVAQSNGGELRLQVTDPSVLGIKCTVELPSEVNQPSQLRPRTPRSPTIRRRLSDNFIRAHHVIILMLQHMAVVDIASGVTFKSSNDGEHLARIDSHRIFPSGFVCIRQTRLAA